MIACVRACMRACVRTCMLVYSYVCVQMLGIYVLVCVRRYVHMYACMYVRVRVIGMKSVNFYIEMFAMGLEKLQLYRLILYVWGYMVTVVLSRVNACAM